jgi:hypothetical protein
MGRRRTLRKEDEVAKMIFKNMKRMVSSFCRLLVFALLLMPLCAFGDGFLDDDLAYGFEDGYSYEDVSTPRVYVHGLRNKSTTHITIPSTVVYEYYDYNDRDDDGHARIKHSTCTVTRIGKSNSSSSGFYQCSSLVSVTIPNSVTSIGGNAFYGCSSLASVAIPNSVTSIGSDTFHGCSSLASVAIGSGVTSIGGSAFEKCRSLTSVTIPNSVTSIEAYTFYGCSSLASVAIGSGVTSIGNRAFAGCSSLASVTIPSSVTNMGDDVFFGCSSLASVTIGSGVMSIGNNAFYNCSSLKSLWMGVSVESIGSSAFYGCNSLEDVMIPECVTNIYYNAFNLCENLQQFSVDQDNPAYASPDGTLCSKDLKTLIVYPRGRVDAKLPDSLMAAMPDAFAGCNKLWMEWCKSINKISYDLTRQASGRAIADVTVSGDMSLDAFVLKEGKVYDSVLYIKNNADHAVRVTLPNGSGNMSFHYQTFKGATPLMLPAYSQSILTITRVAGGSVGGNVFLVTREELETVQ